jgi:lipopolysaccharide export LptBFGC system permease protein LptF
VADSAADRLRLNLYDGRRQTGKPGERRFVTMAFRELSVGIVLPAGTTDCSRPDARHTLDLWNSNGAHERAELNSRLGFIVMTAVLTLIAVVVSRNRPRQSVYSRLPIALGIFAVYQFTATGITAWSARNPALGTLAYWGLHAFAASLATAEFFRGSLQWRNPLFRGSYRAR